jgi:acetyltransferase-like isoleucine patch superfamily enzyme
LEFRSTTLTKTQLENAIEQARRYPHKHVHKGDLVISPRAFDSPGRETNVMISRFALLDCTGSIHIGPWCNISARCRIYTHDHIHQGRHPLLEIEEKHGILWQDKRIGTDVWIHDGAIVLYQANRIPDGVVIGAGSVLTKNPGPYEIWAGNPARKIGCREDVGEEEIQAMVNSNRFLLKN